MDLMQLAFQFDELPEDIEALNAADLERAGEVGLDVARGLSPVLTGALRDSIQISVEPDGVAIWSDLDYAAIQEERHGFLAAGEEAALAELRDLGYE